MLLAGDFIPQNRLVSLPDSFRRQTILANLEGPVCSDGLRKSEKVGLCLHTTARKGMFDTLPRFAFSLANNHLMDYSEEGLRQTVQILGQSSIPWAGAGKNEAEARKPMILEEEGKRIAVFCCCERQFGMATRNTAGCASMGVWLYSAIRKIKASGEADLVIVSCHAASEYSPWVSPTLHDFYHTLVDVGADCIHGHHAHVPQGYEEYKGRPIFYGLGNFVVDPGMWCGNPHQLWSLVVDIRFGKGKVEWSLKPFAVTLTSDILTVSCIAEDDECGYADYLDCANAQFATKDILEACWQEVCVRLYHKLYEQRLRASQVSPCRLSVRDVLRKLMLVIMDFWSIVSLGRKPTNWSRYYAKVLYNYFNCQSHVDSISTALAVLTGSEVDLRSAETRRLAEKLRIRD